MDDKKIKKHTRMHMWTKGEAFWQCFCHTFFCRFLGTVWQYRRIQPGMSRLKPPLLALRGRAALLRGRALLTRLRRGRTFGLQPLLDDPADLG